MRWEGREAAPGGAAAPLCGGRSRCKLGTRTPARSSQTRCLRPMHRFLWHQEKLLPHRFEALLWSLPSFPTALIPLCEQPSLPSFKAPALQDTAVILGCCFIALCLAGKHSQLCLILRVKKKRGKKEQNLPINFSFYLYKLFPFLTHKLEKYRITPYKRSVTSVFRCDLPKGIW